MISTMIIFSFAFLGIHSPGNPSFVLESDGVCCGLPSNQGLSLVITKSIGRLLLLGAKSLLLSCFPISPKGWKEGGNHAFVQCFEKEIFICIILLNGLPYNKSRNSRGIIYRGVSTQSCQWNCQFLGISISGPCHLMVMKNWAGHMSLASCISTVVIK